MAQKVIFVKESDVILYNRVEQHIKKTGESFAGFTAKALRMALEDGSAYDRGFQDGLQSAIKRIREEMGEEGVPFLDI